MGSGDGSLRDRANGDLGRDSEHGPLNEWDEWVHLWRMADFASRVGPEIFAALPTQVSIGIVLSTATYTLSELLRPNPEPEFT